MYNVVESVKRDLCFPSAGFCGVHLECAQCECRGYENSNYKLDSL